MDLELRGQEAETSCDQECGAQDQKGPGRIQESESLPPIAWEGGMWQNFLPLYFLFCYEGKDLRQGGGRGELGPLTATPLSPFSGQEARGHT